MKIKNRFATLLAITALFTGLSVSAQDKKISAAELPAAAQNFIKQHFKDQTVTAAKMDKEMFDIDYETVLSNGTEIEFDEKGNWKEIDGNHNALPVSVIPTAINNYISSNYKGQGVVQIDKKHAGYDIELSNGTELEFDTNGKFLRIDD
ncbi:PepSY-like domain-containing protein [Flavobacterium sp. NRK1]|uniref:PepSY-like domain-containing protein n=1 Tax=Flavobacterium sp. NRK1 TaxID=2954929 RepID=UPI0020930DFE|nr:PepSY-like domain-containing protein [Flavobacterium sp. NRK1]MCO6148503.1 PepSY-like domain-containing protein [Flavobacterium sp. NRK1]